MLTDVFSLYCSNPKVERCQQESYVLNAMARGQSSALSVVALAADASLGSSSVSARGAMEAADVAAMFAAVQQKLNRTHSDDWLVSSTSN
jgi:hypothetical protein